MPKDSIVPSKICFYGNKFGKVIFKLQFTENQDKLRETLYLSKLNANQFIVTAAIPNLKSQSKNSNSRDV